MITTDNFVVEYCKFYNDGKSNKDLAEHFGIDSQRISMRVCQLKKKGIVLPPLARSETKKRVNADNLNEIIRKMTAGAV